MTSQFWLGIAIGAMGGASFGFLCAAMMALGREADERKYTDYSSLPLDLQSVEERMRRMERPPLGAHGRGVLDPPEQLARRHVPGTPYLTLVPDRPGQPT